MPPPKDSAETPSTCHLSRPFPHARAAALSRHHSQPPPVRGLQDQHGSGLAPGGPRGVAETSNSSHGTGGGGPSRPHLWAPEPQQPQKDVVLL